MPPQGHAKQNRTFVRAAPTAADPKGGSIIGKCAPGKLFGPSSVSKKTSREALRTPKKHTCFFLNISRATPSKTYKITTFR